MAKTTSKGETEATSLLARLGVTSTPTPVEEIAARLKIDIYYERFPAETSSVLIRQADGTSVIGVNSRHAPRRQRFSLAHELGHAVMHVGRTVAPEGEAFISKPLEILFRDDVAQRGTDQREIEANAFAAALLMPEPLVRQRFRTLWDRQPSHNIDRVVAELADDFDVSSQAMRFRLVNCGLADPT
jgi:Zn-dependent peptidase ImmA (M78 family)